GDTSVYVSAGRSLAPFPPGDRTPRHSHDTGCFHHPVRRRTRTARHHAPTGSHAGRRNGFRDRTRNPQPQPVVLRDADSHHSQLGGAGKLTSYYRTPDDPVGADPQAFPAHPPERGWPGHFTDLRHPAVAGKGDFPAVDQALAVLTVTQEWMC